MIECGRTPTSGVVTGCALSTKTASVRIILEMAGGAVCWRSLEFGVLVTIRAGSAGMFAVQFEGKLGVIDPGGLPSIRCMTGGAIRSKLTGVRVILEMARGTVHGCTFEDAVLMTILASHCGMGSIEVEGKFRVIHFGWFPGVRNVAGCAVLPKLAVVEIILLVAGVTLLGRGLHIRNGAVVKMTFGAGCLSMFASQIERDPVMVKG